MPELLTAKEAAEFLKIHRRTLYLLARAGTVPSLKIGKSLRFSPDEIVRYAQRQPKASA